MQGDRVMVPVRVLTKAFDAALSWDSATDTVTVTTGSGALTTGNSFYDQESLFWLSRVICAESGNQPLKGQMAVGNVIMNRVNSDLFPDTVLGVVSQKNQFTTYRNGKLAQRTPNVSSVLAAKLVLDGGVVEETRGALYFDSLVNSWASRSKTYIATIGGHKFYR
jgi:N-acetylmuramoyl-L-alanine amidase